MKLKPARIRDSYIVVWATITAVLVLTCAALGIALAAVSRSNTTAQYAKSVAQCINDVLRSRNDLTNQDHVNEAQKIAGQAKAVQDQAEGIRLILTTDPAQQRRGALLYQQGVTEFQQALANWQARDDQINAERAKHPLGRC